MNFTFGSDPEFFLHNGERICSAIAYLPSDDEDKKKIIDNYAFYHDNVLAECTLPPAHSKQETVKIIRQGLQHLTDLTGLTISDLPSAHLHPDELDNEEAQRINCHAEFCAYMQEQVSKNEHMFKNSSLRTAGGHIHLGSPLILEDSNLYITIYLLDLFLGIPSLMLDNTAESKTRRTFYGHAGRFRQCEYGVEYRTLSNFWLTAPALVELIYDICQFTMDFLEEGRWKELWNIDTEKLNSIEAWSDVNFHQRQCYAANYDVEGLQTAINTSHLKTAKPFINLAKKYLSKDIWKRIESHSSNKRNDLHCNWSLK